MLDRRRWSRIVANRVRYSAIAIQRTRVVGPTRSRWTIVLQFPALMHDESYYWCCLVWTGRWQPATIRKNRRIVMKCEHIHLEIIKHKWATGVKLDNVVYGYGVRRAVHVIVDPHRTATRSLFSDRTPANRSPRVSTKEHRGTTK